jgi:putative transposase
MVEWPPSKSEDGVFERIWQAGLLEYDERVGIEWEWQAMDWGITKAPLGEKGTGHNPTDRGKSGTKRSLLTEGRGMPLAVTVEGANRHDVKMVEATLEAIIIERPEPTGEKPQHICLDKGYDYPQVRELVEKWGCTAHIRTCGEEAEAVALTHYGFDHPGAVNYVALHDRDGSILTARFDRISTTTSELIEGLEV